MSNQFGFSGTHGVGKTTVSKELEARGFAVDTHSLPRAAQTALGWDNLRRIEESEENMWALQDMVLVMLTERDKRIRESGVITFVDRTPVDFVGYTTVWATRLKWNIDHMRFVEYINKCSDACEGYGGQFFFPIRNEIPFVPEANRGDLESRELNQRAMLDFMETHGINFHLVQSLEINDRANEILAHLNLRGIK